VLDGLEFVRQAGAFEVSYRASAKPQTLTIEVETDHASPHRSGPVCLRKLLDMINFGAAGGSHFAPELGSAERSEGPWDGDDAFGPSYRWVLNVTGVSPEFLRVAVEHLRRCGWEQPVTAMRIRGALAPNTSALSLRTRMLTGWLDDAQRYPGLFTPVPFPVRDFDEPGARFRVEFAQELRDTHAEQLQAICARWLAATATIVGMNGQPFVRSPEHLVQMLPVFEREPRAFSARMAQFGHAPTPCAALLVNMLSRFHATYAPIARAEVALAGLQYNSAPRRRAKKAAARSSRSATTRVKRPSSAKASR
jgi:hypothetical protein